MDHQTLRLLCDLISINSINPSLVPDGAGEKDIADAVASTLRKSGIEVEWQEAAPGRPNVIGILEGRKPGRTLMFCGHTDTVGVQGMEAPFDPIRRNDRIYGRGAQDMKGGLAAMIGAAKAIAENGGLSSGRLIIAAVSDEEYASVGAEALTKKWGADAAVVPEPTDLLIVVGHKGFAWVDVDVAGRAAHGSRPNDGRDAILRMGRVLAKLEHLDHTIQTRQPHPLLGTGSLHASFVRGGRELSTYPDHCSLQLERRLLTTEPISLALEELNEILDALRKEDPEFEGSAKLLFGRSAYEIPAEHELPRTLESIVKRLGKTTRTGGATYWTDAAILAEVHIDSVVFGPTGAGLHSTEEYVLSEDVLLCQHAFIELIRSYCG
ncbi:M20/M25/M40 family metallo-hydrolase [bacterium]|nr:M20/M25/M40 family metallo-hydrolase [bacterium]